MKSLIIYIAFLFIAAEAFAATPAQELISRYGDMKGIRKVEVSGSKMVFARPILKRYPIGKMADSVMAVGVVNLTKASATDKEAFLNDLKHTMRNYRYYGKSETPEGPVDVYVHLQSDDMVDELVTYNPETYVLNSLIGDFPVKELLSLHPAK